MCVAINLPPVMEQEAREYATVRGTTLEQLLVDYLKDCVMRKKESDDIYAYLMAQSGWLPDDYVFDREEANAR